MAFVTPTNVTVGSVLTASRYNADVTENMTQLAPFFTAWSTYTPTVAQGASTNIAKTVNVARFCQVGKLVIVRLNLSMTAAGTGANNITVSLPVTSAFAGGAQTIVIGEFLYDDQGTATYTGAVQTTSTTTCIMATSTGGVVGANPNFAVASGDTIRIGVMYEAA
jgi:hypothetical protein